MATPQPIPPVREIPFDPPPNTQSCIWRNRIGISKVGRIPPRSARGYSRITAVLLIPTLSFYRHSHCSMFKKPFWAVSVEGDTFCRACLAYSLNKFTLYSILQIQRRGICSCQKCIRELKPYSWKEKEKSMSWDGPSLAVPVKSVAFFFFFLQPCS